MDLNNLYPTTYTNGVGYNADQFTVKLTNSIGSVGVSDSYFLGYVNPTEIPSTSFSTKVTYNSDEDIIKFESCKKNNVEVGYVKNSLGNWNSYGFSQSNDNDTYNYNLGNFNYYNNFYPEFASMAEALRLYVTFILYNPLGEYISFGYTFKTLTGSQPYGTYINMWKFFNGEIGISFSISGHTFTVNFEEFVSGNGTVFSFAADGYQARLFLTNFWLAGGSIYNGSWSGSNLYGYNVKTSGTFEDGTEAKLYIFGQRFGADPGSVYCQFITGNVPGYGTRRLTKNETYERGYGLFNNVEISPSDLPSTVDTFTFYNGVIVQCGATNAYYNFYIYITNPISIKNILGLAFRTNPGSVASYVNESSYATNVDGNKFVSTLKTGNITDAEFKSGLEPWQYVDFDTYDPITNPQGVEVNTFTEEDLPPFVPPSGEEGNNPDNPELTLSINNDTPADDIDDETYIDTPINFPISSFMTQYILDVNDVYDMGQTLWSGLGDPNSHMIDNIIRVYGSTGTFNIANIMDLFVSVKAFPFNLIDANYNGRANAMTVGTGAVPILNKPVPTFTASTYVLDCGTVSTVQEGAYRFGSDFDFRNYVNVAISCFLPFCGTIELDPSDVFPYNLHCIYFIDMLSGSCTACVYVARDGSELLVGSKNGQIGKIVPLSANNLMGVVGAALSDVTAIAQTIGQTLLNAAEKKALGSTQMPINEASKNADYMREVAKYKENQSRISEGYGSIRNADSMASNAAQGISNVMTRNGVSNPSLSPGVGLETLNVCRRPYITIRKLKYSSPNNYAHTTGFKCTDGTERKTISSYKGYTVFQNVDLSGIVATQEELVEIKALLETGVYL